MRKAIQERNRFKRNTWNFFSSKEYQGMSDRYFLNVIFKKAQKTYYEYVSFYNSLDKENAISFVELKTINTKLSKVFLSVTEIQTKFKTLIKELKLEKDFLVLINNLEETAFSIWRDCLEKEKALAA